MNAAADEIRFCSSIDTPVGTGSAQMRGVARRAALLNAAFWGQGSTITVAFLGAEPPLHRRVADIAKRWTTETDADIKFEFWIESNRDARDAHVRIDFDRARGSWSVLGKLAQGTDRNAPTMNLGWMTMELPEAEARAVVLHEFGHALGLIHEHLSPVRSIQWNKAAVTADLKRTQGWDDATIASNMFAQYDLSQVFATDIDPLSIMMYPIPPSWTNGTFTAGFNTALTEQDKALIRKAYGTRPSFGPPRAISA